MKGRVKTCVACGKTFPEEELIKTIHGDGEGVVFKCRRCGGNRAGKNSGMKQALPGGEAAAGNQKKTCRECGRLEASGGPEHVLFIPYHLPGSPAYRCIRCADKLISENKHYWNEREYLEKPPPPGTRLVANDRGSNLSPVDRRLAALSEALVNEHGVRISIKSSLHRTLVSFEANGVSDDGLKEAVRSLLTAPGISMLTIGNGYYDGCMSYGKIIKKRFLPPGIFPASISPSIKDLRLKNWIFPADLRFPDAELNELNLSGAMRELPRSITRLKGVKTLRISNFSEERSVLDFSLIAGFPLQNMNIRGFTVSVNTDAIAGIKSGNGLWRIRLYYCGLESVPAGISKHPVEVLFLNGNKISSLPAELLSLDRVRYLNFDDNPFWYDPSPDDEAILEKLQGTEWYGYGTFSYRKFPLWEGPGGKKFSRGKKRPRPRAVGTNVILTLGK